MNREEIIERLRNDLELARARRNKAAELFDLMIKEVPSGIPHPDGTDRVNRSSRDFKLAQEQLTEALVNLNDYLIHGTMPNSWKGRPTPPA